MPIFDEDGKLVKKEPGKKQPQTVTNKYLYNYRYHPPLDKKKPETQLPSDFWDRPPLDDRPAMADYNLKKKKKDRKENPVIPPGPLTLTPIPGYENEGLVLPHLINKHIPKPMDYSSPYATGIEKRLNPEEGNYNLWIDGRMDLMAKNAIKEGVPPLKVLKAIFDPSYAGTNWIWRIQEMLGRVRELRIENLKRLTPYPLPGKIKEWNPYRKNEQDI